MTPKQFRQKEQENVPVYTPVILDMSLVIELRKERGVKRFDEFPENTKAIYLNVAKCFPGVQVWACGSRVRGDYKSWKDNFFEWLARSAAGMKDKRYSDFDFWTTGTPVCELPKNTDHVRGRVPENEKIPIPIYVELGTTP